MCPASPGFPTEPCETHSPRRRRLRPRDVVIGIPAAVILFLLLGHGVLPEAGGLALVVQSFLPWLGIVVVLLLLAAVAGRARFGAIPVVAAAVSWTVLFAPVLLAGPAAGTAYATAGTSTDAVTAQESEMVGETTGLKVITQNLRAGNPDTAVVVEGLASSGADVEIGRAHV